MTYRADTGEELVSSAVLYPARVFPTQNDYRGAKEQIRINDQHDRIKRLMLDGQWRTVREISVALCYPETSVSAQLRHLRKPQFGGFIVHRKKRINTNESEYCVERPKAQQDLFVIKPTVRWENLP